MAQHAFFSFRERDRHSEGPLRGVTLLGLIFSRSSSRCLIQRSEVLAQEFRLPKSICISRLQNRHESSAPSCRWVSKCSVRFREHCEVPKQNQQESILTTDSRRRLPTGTREGLHSSLALTTSSSSPANSFLPLFSTTAISLQLPPLSPTSTPLARGCLLSSEREDVRTTHKSSSGEVR